jgi:hypothetical protein
MLESQERRWSLAVGGSDILPATNDERLTTKKLFVRAMHEVTLVQRCMYVFRSFFS